MIEIRTKKELVANGKTFYPYSYIAFTGKNRNTGNWDRIIGRIIDMIDSCNGYIIVDMVEINQEVCGINDKKVFFLDEVKDFNYVSCD